MIRVVDDVGEARVAESLVIAERSGGIAILTLNRPEALNALSSELRAELVRRLRELAADDEVRVVILTGAGRAFSAGLDLKELGGEGPSSSTGPRAAPVAADADADADADVVAALRALPQPVIGAINGFAITGGFEIALACDLLIASSEARFADTHARVGVMPGWGLSQRLPRLVGLPRAKEISLTGNYVSAEQAERWGLVNRVVPPDQLLPTVRRLAQDMLSCDPDLLRGYKQVLDEGYATTLAEGLEVEQRASRALAIRPERVAERRKSIQERGRSQSSREG
jgi:enoyl-CoA hydratase